MARERQSLIGGTKETEMENGQYQEQDTDGLRLAKLGAFGIICESIKCYSNQARYFSRILFTLGIPLFLYMTVVKILSPSFLTRASMSSQVPSPLHAQRFSSIAASATGDPDELADRITQLWTGLFLENNLQVWSELFKTAIPILGLLIGTSLLNQVCQALSDSGTIYTVGLIYCRASQLRKNSVVPFVDHVLRKAPRLLYRVMRTWLWTLFFLMILFIVFVVSQVVIVFLPLSLEAILLPIVILSLSFLTCLVGIGTLADVAESVTILDPEESSYGLEAFKKARALLKGKWMVAVQLSFVWVSILVLIDFIQPAATANPWDPIRVLVIVMTCVVISVVNQARVISAGVLYVSLKAFHGETCAGLATEGTAKRLSISSASCATHAAHATGVYGLAEKQAPGTDHRYSLLSV